MVDLTWTNTWLGILAVISLIQFLMMFAAVFLAYRMYQRTVTMIENVERVHVAPLRARVEALFDEVELTTEKVRQAHDSVSDALRHITGAGSAVAGAVRSKAWPILGIIQGVRSIASGVIGNGRHDRGDRPYGAM